MYQNKISKFPGQVKNSIALPTLSGRTGSGCIRGLIKPRRKLTRTVNLVKSPFKTESFGPELSKEACNRIGLFVGQISEPQRIFLRYSTTGLMYSTATVDPCHAR